MGVSKRRRVDPLYALGVLCVLLALAYAWADITYGPGIYGSMTVQDLVGCDTIDTDSSGVMTCGTDDGAAAEANDLTAAVTWANVPDANVAGVDERDEVCGTTTLSASCEVLWAQANDMDSNGDVDHANLSNIGTNTHAQLDTHVGLDHSGVGACTNQFVRALNDEAAPTCATVDISSDTNLAAGRSITLSGDSLEVDQEAYDDDKCVFLPDPDDANDIMWYRTNNAITVVALDCISENATSAVVVIVECDANGDNCGSANTRLEESMTCAVTNTSDDGTIGNATIAAGAWFRAQVGTVTGTPGETIACMYFTRDDG